MTGNIFVDCVFLFLICYAIVSIFYNLSEFLLKRYCKYPKKTFLVLDIKPESNSLEYDVRCAINKSLENKCALVIVCGELSQDENKALWRLTDVYEHIILTTREELIHKLDTAENISMSL